MATITFTPTTWVDDTTPAITAAQLNRLEAAVDDVINGGGDLDLGSNDLILGGEIKTGNGAAATPSIAFESDTNTGMYRITTDMIGFATAGTERLRLTTGALQYNATGGISLKADGAGDVSTPGYSFNGDEDTGMYRGGSNDLRFAAGGSAVLQMDGTLTYMAPVYSDTTASAANIQISSSGRMRRSTSALKYKEQVERLDLRGAPLPSPVRYRSKIDGNMYYGFIADEVAELYPDAAVYNDEGEVEDYDAKALLALMVAGGVLR